MPSLPSKRSAGEAASIDQGRLGVWAGLASDPIADAVQEAICEGRLPAGTRLGEEELCRIFGVSRTLVRQALQRLGFAGLVTLLGALRSGQFDDLDGAAGRILFDDEPEDRPPPPQPPHRSLT